MCQTTSTAELGERSLDVRDLGTGVDYAVATSLQESLHAARVADQTPDTLLLLEHAPVYTLGRSADNGNLLWNADECRRRGIALETSSRGGDVTYHGPGQLVGYPILKLPEGGRQVLGYVERLETVLIDAVADFGIRARRDRRNRGIWVGNAKLAALGVRISKGVSQHGFALNVDVDFAPYAGIVACGLRDAAVTSLARLTSVSPEMAAVKRSVERHFRAIFGYAA